MAADSERVTGHGLAGDGAGDGDGKEPLLSVEGLRTVFFTPEGLVRAVDGLTLDLRPGETLGLVGETGCGKTVAALSVTGMLPRPQGAVVGGAVRFRGEDLLTKKPAELRRIRNRDIAMIFQEPRAALNPVLTVGEQLKEALLYRDGALPRLDGWLRARGVRTPRVREAEAAAREEAIRWLRVTGVADPEHTFDRYPHELSAGVCQRIMIAMALSREPRLLIADEPTTALDVTIQAQILELMKDLQQRLDTATLLITHHMALVAETCDRVAVMYAGRVVEVADTDALFENPRHPYTKALLAALPDRAEPGAPLESIPGRVPDMVNPPGGCRFHPRCPIAEARCRSEAPRLEAGEGGHGVACHLAEPEGGDAA